MTAAAYLILLGHRLDYLGHFLAGFGGTLLLLAFVLMVVRRPRWIVVLVVGVAIAIGWFTEATVFRLAIFDPVDFCNQSLGACIAGAGSFDRTMSLGSSFVLGLFAVVLISAGFFYAFA